MDYETKRQKLINWLETNKSSQEIQAIKDLRSKYEEALYSVNEMGLWPDDVDVSFEQASMVWSLLEILRNNDFPSELRM